MTGDHDGGTGATTDEELAAIRRRAERWLMPEVGAFHLRNDVLALLAEVERQRGQLDEAHEHLIRNAGAAQRRVGELAKQDQRMAALEEIARAMAMMRPVPILSVSGKHVCAGCQQVFTDDGHGWFTEGSRHAADCPVTKARALLGMGEAPR